MPTTCTELVLSRRVVYGQSAELLYLIQGTASEADAMAAVLAAAPATYDFDSGSGSGSGSVSLPRQPPELEPIHVDESGGVGMWEARVRYQDNGRGSSPPPQDDENTFSFDTTGGTQKITQSLNTVASYSAGGSGSTAPDFKGAIGFDGEKVEGCDITVPVFKFGETHWKAPSFVDQAYKIKVMEVTGQVNGAAFRGFSAGEVLFLGVSGARRGRSSDDLWELTYHFAASKNRTGLTVGPITGIAKKGWEYLWVLYEDGVDATAKSRVRTPIGAYVEQVYRAGDFSWLDIG